MAWCDGAARVRQITPRNGSTGFDTGGVASSDPALSATCAQSLGCRQGYCGHGAAWPTVTHRWRETIARASQPTMSSILEW